jgi:hypothetical protein
MANGDGVELNARHLLVCREVLHDPFQPGAAYSLKGLVVSFQPADDIGYPMTVESLVLFAQVYGDAGRFVFWVDLYEILDDADDRLISTYGPTVGVVREGRFIDALTIPVWNVPFPRPGVYEFRLRRDAVVEPMISERLLLKD